MSETLEQYYKEREHDYMMTLLFEGVQDGGVKVSYAAKKAELSCWNFYINSNSETMKTYELAQNEYTELLISLKKLKKINL